MTENNLYLADYLYVWLYVSGLQPMTALAQLVLPTALTNSKFKFKFKFIFCITLQNIISEIWHQCKYATTPHKKLMENNIHKL